MSSIMRRRNGLIASSVMGMLLSRVKVVDPSSQDRTPPCATVLAPPPAAANYRASGLVLWHDSEVPARLAYVRYRGQTGKHMLGVRFFAVGTAVASRPPHRSVRAGFPHTAPTLSLT